MQILHVYKNSWSKMVEFDYLENSLVLYINDSSLMLDPMPVISREPKYQAKKPRSSYADNPHI